MRFARTFWPSEPSRPPRRSPVASAFIAASALTLAACNGGRTPESAASQQAAVNQTGLVIAELLPDPVGVADDHGEWIALRNDGSSPLELRGWSLRSANDAGFRITESLVLAPDSQVVLARDTDPRTNGGLRSALKLRGITLANRADWVALITPDGVTTDSLSWGTTTPGATISGRRTRPGSVDVAATVLLAPADQKLETTVVVRAPITVRILDVGQGDAILVTNGESSVLIDGGPDPARLGTMLDSLGIHGQEIDVVILTHQHYDHHSGLRALFDTRRKIAVRYFFENLDPYPNAALASLRDSVGARAKRGELRLRDTDDPCADGQPMCTIALRGGALMHIMRPYPRSSDANDRSVAVKLVGPDSASFTMWLAGDAERPAIRWFGDRNYDQRPGMDVNVLKLDHHGSCDGITAQYLALTTPDWAVASLSARNDYGYMHSQTTELLRQHSVPWYRTDANGTITITSSGTPGGGYTITPSRGDSSASGPMDRYSSQRDCRTM